jgi:hypothetical protein
LETPLWKTTVAPVGEKKSYKKCGKGLITVDSGAEESCWPKDLLPEVKVTKAEKKRRFVAANGTAMNHYGEKVVKFKGGNGGVASMKFQVSDVTKPLASVARITEQGNIVQMGPRPADNFIMNVESRRKIPLEKRGGCYVMPAEWLTDEMDVPFARRV